MKLITRDTDYAIRALGYLARHQEEIVSVSQLVKELKIPRPFLRKNLQILEKKCVLRSYKGKGGGFTLTMPARKIFILDLMNIFQGDFKLNECLFKKNICPNTGDCALKRKIDKMEEYVIRQLRSIHIAHLF